MMATAAGSVTRRLAGPTGARLCMRGDEGWRWAEQVSGSPTAYLDAQQLELLRAHVPEAGGVRARVPQLTDPQVALWPAVPTPALLVDAIYADAPRAELEDRMRGLGLFLAALHGVTLDAVAASELPRRGRTAPWLLAAPPLAARHKDARLRLAAHASHLAELAGAEPPGDRRATLVHGRFSAAQCVPLPTHTVLLGWREAGVGDPAQDVAFMLGELVEAVAVAPADAPALLGAAAGLAGGYGGLGDIGIAGLVANRILDHLALRICVAGMDDGLLSLLLAADRCIDRVLEAVTDDAC